MKSFKILLLTLLPLGVSAQSGSFAIKGQLGKLNSPAKVYLIYKQGPNQQKDSASISNGAFEFKGAISEPVKARLVIDYNGKGIRNLRNSDNVEFYVENGNITISSPDSAFKAQVKGTKTNEESNTFLSVTASARKNMKDLQAEYASASDEKKASKDYQQDLQTRYKSYDDEIKKCESDFIKQNPNSFIALDLVKNSGGSIPDADQLESLFKGLSEQVRNSASGKELTDRIAKLKLIAVGALAPEFSHVDMDNNMIKLSDYKGKYVLVDFWASWCGPCRAENPKVVLAYNQFKDKNFTILGVSIDTEKAREAWLAAIKKDQLTWTQVCDTKNEVASLYAVKAVPQNFLIDPSGKIIAKNLRGEALAQKLTEILGN